MRALLFAAALGLCACKGASVPTPDADAAPVVEAGVAVASDVCSIIEGVDDSGVVRTVCATVEEIAEVIAFILTLRTADAGAPPKCTNLPGTSFCASKAEIAKGIVMVVRVRQARLMIDGGAK